MKDYRKDMHRVIVDPDKAVIFPGATLAPERKVVGFHKANMFEEDWNWRNGALIGYSMHPHCWLLVDRFLGHEVVKQDLRAFIRDIKIYWRGEPTLWMPHLIHDPQEYPCYDHAAL